MFRSVSFGVTKTVLFVNDTAIENVKQSLHLVQAIRCDLSDHADIIIRRSSFDAQVNNLITVISQTSALDSVTRSRPFSLLLQLLWLRDVGSTVLSYER
jgi:hypothetical protein